MLLSEPLVDEFAERLRRVSAKDVDTLMQSFLFKNSSKRIELADTFAAYA